MPNPKGHEDSIKDSRFKGTWKSGPTRTIRVPIALADTTLEYARQLDQGAEARDTTIKANVEVDGIMAEPRDTASKLSEKLTPDAAIMLSKLRAKRKKSKVELGDVEALLKLLQ